MWVMYLDFDGVLHDSEVWWSPERGAYLDVPDRTLFEWTPILQSLLTPYPDVSIVLSTSWVRVVGFDRAKSFLPHGLQSKVVGATFEEERMTQSQFQRLTRAEQILTDVYYRKPSFWFAIDDDAFKWPEWCRDRLVKTLGAYGLSDQNVQRALSAMLVRMSASS